MKPVRSIVRIHDYLKNLSGVVHTTMVILLNIRFSVRLYCGPAGSVEELFKVMLSWLLWEKFLENQWQVDGKQSNLSSEVEFE